MAEESTILINKSTIELLKKAKENSRQTYNDLLEKMAKLFIAAKASKNSEYDRFLHEIQKRKMKELWNNEYDEVWEKYNFGDVILALVQYTDTNEVKTRPAIVLFEEYNNIIVMGVTSNPHMDGISLTKNEGMTYDSVIKVNYIMTLSEKQVKKQLFTISEEKKKTIKEELIKRLK